MSTARIVDDSSVQPIPIEEFLSRSVVLVDTYIRLISGKYILIAKAGQNTNDTTLEKYREKKIESLYVHVDDYHRFLVVNADTVRHLAESPTKISANPRALVIQDAMSTIYKEIGEMGFTEEAFARAKLVNHALLAYVKDNSVVTDLIYKFGQTSKEGVSHAMMVSMIAVMIGTKHDWVKPATLEKLSLGGFLHDIGKTKLPPEISNKPPSALTRDEKIIYESHVESGAQILSQAKTMPDDVLLIVLEHHERADGSGYPKKLKDFQISPLARVVALANAFVDRISDESKPLSPKDTIRVYDEFRLQRAHMFNRDALKALEKCLDPKKFEVTKKRVG